MFWDKIKENEFRFDFMQKQVTFVGYFYNLKKRNNFSWQLSVELEKNLVSYWR